MTNKQLEKKIEEILGSSVGTFMSTGSKNIAVRKLLSLCKKYALSVLPEEDIDERLKLDLKFNVDMQIKRIIKAQGFNQAIKQAEMV
jgi:hypothetical protein